MDTPISGSRTEKSHLGALEKNRTLHSGRLIADLGGPAFFADSDFLRLYLAWNMITD